MSAYVEPLAFHGWRLHGKSVHSCHLIADTEEELHRFAQLIGLKRSWAHQSSFLHYDLTAAKRAQAIAYGAVELTRTEFVAVMRRLKKRKAGGGVNKFNNLTPAQEEQLYLLTEEASEVIQAVQKILRHGYDRCNPFKPEMNNRQDLEKELGHLYHAISRLNSKNEISLTRIANHCHKKEANIAPYLHHQEEGMA